MARPAASSPGPRGVSQLNHLSEVEPPQAYAGTVCSKSWRCMNHTPGIGRMSRYPLPVRRPSPGLGPRRCAHAAAGGKVFLNAEGHPTRIDAVTWTESYEPPGGPPSER